MPFLFYNHRERNTGKWSSLPVVSHQLTELCYGILAGLKSCIFFFLAFVNVTVGLARLGDNFLWVSDISACLRNRVIVWYCWKSFQSDLYSKQGLKAELGVSRAYNKVRTPEVQHWLLEMQATARATVFGEYVYMVSVGLKGGKELTKQTQAHTNNTTYKASWPLVIKFVIFDPRCHLSAIPMKLWQANLLISTVKYQSQLLRLKSGVHPIKKWSTDVKREFSTEEPKITKFNYILLSCLFPLNSMLALDSVIYICCQLGLTGAPRG